MRNSAHTKDPQATDWGVSPFRTSQGEELQPRGLGRVSSPQWARALTGPVVLEPVKPTASGAWQVTQRGSAGLVLSVQVHV